MQVKSDAGTKGNVYWMTSLGEENEYINLKYITVNSAFKSYLLVSTKMQ